MLSKTEKENIRNEIQKEMDSLIHGCETLNMVLMFKVYSKSEDFYMIAGDGNAYSYQEFYNNNAGYLGMCNTFELETKKMDMNVLSADIVVVSWLYKAVATFKNGNKDVIENAGATFLFNKINGVWTVINYQESSLPPVTITSEGSSDSV